MMTADLDREPPTDERGEDPDIVTQVLNTGAPLPAGRPVPSFYQTKTLGCAILYLRIRPIARLNSWLFFC